MNPFVLLIPLLLYIVLDLLNTYQNLLRTAAIFGISVVVFHLVPHWVFGIFYLWVASNLYRHFHNTNTFPSKWVLLTVSLLWPIVLVVTSILNI